MSRIGLAIWPRRRSSIWRRRRGARARRCMPSTSSWPSALACGPSSGSLKTAVWCGCCASSTGSSNRTEATAQGPDTKGSGGCRRSPFYNTLRCSGSVHGYTGSACKRFIKEYQRVRPDCTNCCNCLGWSETRRPASHTPPGTWAPHHLQLALHPARFAQRWPHGSWPRPSHAPRDRPGTSRNVPEAKLAQPFVWLPVSVAAYDAVVFWVTWPPPRFRQIFFRSGRS